MCHLHWQKLYPCNLLYSYLYGALCAYIKSTEFCWCRWHTSRGYLYNTGILILWFKLSFYEISLIIIECVLYDKSRIKGCSLYLSLFKGIHTFILIIHRKKSLDYSTKLYQQTQIIGKANNLIIIFWLKEGAYVGNGL